jgi:hypothetical protein
MSTVIIAVIVVVVVEVGVLVLKLFYNNDEMKRSPLAYRRRSLLYLSHHGICLLYDTSDPSATFSLFSASTSAKTGDK